MPENGNVRDNLNLPSWLAKLKSESRWAVAKSRALLDEPSPDTFLGRQHRDMIPLPEPEE